MENKKLLYEKPELTLKYFVFGGDIATISGVNSQDAPDQSDPGGGNVVPGSELPGGWW